LSIVAPLRRAFFYEVLERFIVRQSSQYCFSLCRIRYIIEDPFPKRLQLGKKLTVLLGENFLQLFSYMAGISWIMTFSADGYLQIATLNNSRHEKITKLRLVNDVAQDLQLLTIFIYLLIELVIIRCRYCKNRTRKIIFGIFGSYQLSVPAPAMSRQHIVDMLGNHNQSGTRRQNRLGFPHCHCPTAYYDNSAATQLQIYRVLRHGFILPYMPQLQEKFKKN
jgi:hypothetical protein